MIGTYRELEGCIRLFVHVFGRLEVLRLPPVKEQLRRQIYFTGAGALAGFVLRGALIGTFIIAYVMDVLEADVSLAVKILLWVVLRELGPLLAAILVLQRSGAAVAAELSLMHITGEISSLRRMRIDPYDFLLTPRVVGIALSTAVLTVYVQVIAVAGGMLLAGLVIDATFSQLLSNFFQLASPLDMIYSLIKSLLFGVTIAVIACYHGLHPRGGSINAVPKSVVSAVSQSTVMVLLINVVFAYVVYGQVLFGLIKAKV